VDDQEPHPIERLLGVLDAWRAVFGGAIAFAVGLAFLIMGHTAGRLIGVGLIVLLLVPWIKTVRRHLADRNGERS